MRVGGVTIKSTAWTPAPRTTPDDDRLERALRLAEIMRGRRTVVLTGAGISTPSGIPDYRGPDSTGRTPMTFHQFVEDPDFRRHYWARNHLGWRFMEAACPNRAHLVVADWERRGAVIGVITQNVDLLHLKAGTRTVLDLHGTYGVVRCLDCGGRLSRWALDQQLTELNPDFRQRIESRGAIEVAPDADAVLDDTTTFRVADCRACGGVLKPDIVYFGESVPVDRVRHGQELVESADVVLAVGTSLTVQSGFRFVRHARSLGKDVVVVNRGRTRAHDIATLTIDGDCVEVLSAVEAALGGSGASGPEPDRAPV